MVLRNPPLARHIVGYHFPSGSRKKYVRHQLYNLSMDNHTDIISQLAEEAHEIFNAASIYEVIDLQNRQAAEDYLCDVYGFPDKENIIKYLNIIDKLR